MTVSVKAPVLVVVQLSGGNDFMNTIIPYTNGIYYDSRPTVHIPADQVLPLNDALAPLAPASPEAATLWTGYLSEWTFWNSVRTVAPIISAALFIWALMLQAQ